MLRVKGEITREEQHREEPASRALGRKTAGRRDLEIDSGEKGLGVTSRSIAGDRSEASAASFLLAAAGLAGLERAELHRLGNFGQNKK